MVRASVLAISVLVNIRVIWAAFASQTASVDTALVRVLITVPVVAVLLAGVRAAARVRSPEPDQGGNEDGPAST